MFVDSVSTVYKCASQWARKSEQVGDSWTTPNMFFVPSRLVEWVGVTLFVVVEAQEGLSRDYVGTDTVKAMVAERKQEEGLYGLEVCWDASRIRCILAIDVVA